MFLLNEVILVEMVIFFFIIFMIKYNIFFKWEKVVFMLFVKVNYLEYILCGVNVKYK